MPRRCRRASARCRASWVASPRGVSSARAGSVELYRCVDFPLVWKRERVLMEGVRLVDATLYKTADRWWMFANSAAGESRMFDDELHLYHAERLTGDWQPHAKNPVKS